MTEAAVPSARFVSCPQCLAHFRTRPRRCPLDGAALIETATDPMIGTVVGGRYLIEAAIGEGGIGRVYRAKHVRISRQYAIKIPFGELASDDNIRRRLANEAEAASRVQHPNLVGVVDVGETPAGLFYLAMDLVTGASLATLIEAGPMPVERALRLVAQIADGLAHAHARGLVHRDLKPDNIIVEQDEGEDRARIVDFGIALVQDDMSRRMTAEGMVIGTPEYMSPEQLVGQPIDARTDLFALGLVLYELVTGVTPFTGSSLDIATKNLTQPLPPMATRLPGKPIDPRVEALATWMTRKKPAERPANAELVADEVRALLEDPAVSARPLPPRRKPITFSPLPGEGAPAAAPAPHVTAEAWSPIVVPAAVSTTEEISAAMMMPVTGEQRVSSTIRAPVIPPPVATPARAMTPPAGVGAPPRRAVGSAPPPPGEGGVVAVDDAVEVWPAMRPASSPPVTAPVDGTGSTAIAILPWWRRPVVIAAAAIGAAVVAGTLAIAL